MCPSYLYNERLFLDTSVCDIGSQLYISYLQESKGHDGAKPSMCVYLNNGKIFTTGFSRMSERQYALWDEVKLFEIFKKFGPCTII